MSVLLAEPTLASPMASGLSSAGLDAPRLPEGFPAQLQSQLAWTGSSMSEASNFILKLSDAEIAEINAALEFFKTLGDDGDAIKPSNFPLPTLGLKLADLSRDIHEGQGVAVIRGLNPASFPVEDLTMIYLGVSSYIAEQRGRQDKRGNMLGFHIVADNSTKQAAEHHRHSTKEITFHNEEAGDVVGWLTRSTAAAGGKCIVASAYTIYNFLAATRPDLIRTLARSDWPFALPKFHCRPVIFHEDGKLIMNFGRAALLGNDAHPRPSHLPTLTSQQKEALDAIESIAKATQLEIQTQAGDMHFINNLVVLHRREGFVNGEASSEKRHLVRMRLRSTEHGWSIPSALEQEWNKAFGEKGGKHWHLEPMPASFFPLARQPN
ncbi:hypothetical protein QBC38DRAFT_451036 [Podospora fimiseda]|uniref:TauD/TfdA-like domain-containing protein n=1 Tax=Podospora fimiseda TaxID=252190 RepID=A0AAN7BY65_9PEZI|nr:hypothetical protein QBC38DRAFT_451036 [Podospora fimiseda]